MLIWVVYTCFILACWFQLLVFFKFVIFCRNRQTTNFLYALYASILSMRVKRVSFLSVSRSYTFPTCWGRSPDPDLHPRPPTHHPPPQTPCSPILYKRQRYGSCFVSTESFPCHRVIDLCQSGKTTVPKESHDWCPLASTERTMSAGLYALAAEMERRGHMPFSFWVGVCSKKCPHHLTHHLTHLTHHMAFCCIALFIADVNWTYL